MEQLPLHLSRRDDPETSHLAAATLDLGLSQKHWDVLMVLRGVCPATDLEMAMELSRRGFGREESCRRLIRTLREEHDLLVAALDANGQQLRHLNPTGRWGDCWRINPNPNPEPAPDPEPEPPVDTPAARLARCEYDIHSGAVSFDGKAVYSAAVLWKLLHDTA